MGTQVSRPIVCFPLKPLFPGTRCCCGGAESRVAKAGMEEWDGNAKLSRSQSIFAAGGGGIVHNLGLGNSPVSCIVVAGDGEREKRRWQSLRGLVMDFAYGTIKRV